jgi:hypothetical protein
MMPVQTNPQQHRRQSDRLASMAQDAPRSLARVLTALTTCMIEAAEEVPDRVNSRQVNGPGGSWLVSRFTAHGQPWVGVQWPEGLNTPAVEWLKTTAGRNGLSAGRPDTPYNQLWIHLGAE